MSLLALRKEVSPDNERLSALLQITEIGLSSLSLDELLQNLIKRMVEITKAKAGIIWIIDKQKRTLFPMASRGISDRYMPFFTMPVGKHLAGTIASKGIPLTLKDLPIPQRAQFYIQEQKIKSMLGVPLKVKGNIIGVARLDYLEERSFSDFDIELFQVLADRASISIENARLYKQQEDIATSLQKSLRPPEPPLQEFDIGVAYRSATEAALVGGDFYDFFDKNDELYVLIGDVSGKGVESAIDAAIVKYSVRLLLSQDQPPQKLLYNVNNFLERQFSQGKFVTAVLARIDKKKRYLTIFIAGHPPPLLFNSQSKAGYFIDEKSASAIGVFRNEKFASSKTKLKKNDIFVLYTDGVIEAKSNGNMYEETRIYNAVSKVTAKNARSIVEEIATDVRNYSKDRLTDDIAIIAIKF